MSDVVRIVVNGKPEKTENLGKYTISIPEIDRIIVNRESQKKGA